MTYDIIKKNFLRGLWDGTMVHKAVEKGIITEEQYLEIISGKSE